MDLSKIDLIEAANILIEAANLLIKIDNLIKNSKEKERKERQNVLQRL